MSKNKVEWTQEWPKEPGYYWFYGRRFRTTHLKQEDNSIYFVEVFISSNKSPVYICSGNFLSKGGGAEGWWTRAELPDPPKEAKDWRRVNV